MFTLDCADSMQALKLLLLYWCILCSAAHVLGQKNEFFFFSKKIVFDALCTLLDCSCIAALIGGIFGHFGPANQKIWSFYKFVLKACIAVLAATPSCCLAHLAAALKAPSACFKGSKKIIFEKINNSSLNTLR